MGKNLKLIIIITITAFNIIFCSNYLLAQSQSGTLPDSISGLRLYKPDKTCKGYTIIGPMTQNLKMQILDDAYLINMDGDVERRWNISAFPAKILPGGSIMGSKGISINQSLAKIVQVNWTDDTVEWEFDKWVKRVEDDSSYTWFSRQHHDYIREGNPVGYYAPGQDPKTDGGYTLVLAHQNVEFPRITKNRLLDDVIYEVDGNGYLVNEDEGGFRWLASEHFDEFGFDEDAIFALKGASKLFPLFDWLHINSMSLVGPNKWHNAGDERFHPDNIIIDSRNANFIAIISRDTGKVVWRVGPDYTEGKPEYKLGKIVGQHHAHIIPEGLPGAGNVLVFDNGGAGGYGSSFFMPLLPGIFPSELRPYSRVIEFDPQTLDIVWEYSDKDGFAWPLSGKNHLFFSIYISSAQRLPNGNTLITEGATGRIFEVTNDKEVVWEYVSPHYSITLNAVYRAYRVPSKWLMDKKGRMLRGMDGKRLVNYYENDPLNDPYN